MTNLYNNYGNRYTLYLCKNCFALRGHCEVGRSPLHGGLMFVYNVDHCD